MIEKQGSGIVILTLTYVDPDHNLRISIFYKSNVIGPANHVELVAVTVEPCWNLTSLSPEEGQGWQKNYNS